MTVSSRTRIKICGITRPADALTAANLGADAIGLVFVPASARHVSLAQAREIIGALPPLVSVVGLFMDAHRAVVAEALVELPLGWLQFHGSETADWCESFGRPYIKAVPMGAGARLQDYERVYPCAAALLADSHGGARIGGTGERFDWSRIPGDGERSRPLVLAGGLDPDNVSDAVRRVRPWAVDVSSGVERARGIKDAHRVAAFIAAVRRADRAMDASAAGQTRSRAALP